MSSSGWNDIIQQLKKHGVVFAAGLSDKEVERVEGLFGFSFPVDLRAFLQTALPRGERFPNWRAGRKAVLRDWLDLPRCGIIFDVQVNHFWLPEWGLQP